MNKKAFTLIELIVVITILSILWTIAFISFKWYSTQARDSKRITEISSLNNSLWIYLAKKWTLPEPESSIRVAYGSEEMTIQWEMGENVLSQISASQNFKDPSSLDYYFYSINSSKNWYDVFALLEWDSSYVTSAKASWDKNIFVKWTDVWYVFNSDWTELTWDLDIKWNSGTFQLFTRDWIIFDAKELDLLYLKSNFNDFLVGHWDMSTKNQDWTLKDLSWKWNKWTITWNPVILNWKMVFDGIDDYIEVADSSSLDIPKSITILVKFKSTEDKNAVLLNKRNTEPRKTSSSWNFKISHNLDNNIWFFYQPTTIIDKASYTPHNTFFDNLEHTLVIKNIFNDSNSLVLYNNWNKGNLAWAPWREGGEGVIINANSLVIWAEKDSSNTMRNYFKWEIDEIKIFNIALPENAIIKLSK